MWRIMPCIAISENNQIMKTKLLADIQKSLLTMQNKSISHDIVWAILNNSIIFMHIYFVFLVCEFVHPA